MRVERAGAGGWVLPGGRWMVRSDEAGQGDRHRGGNEGGWAGGGCERTVWGVRGDARQMPA